jgi:hypothetical protein
MLFAHSFDGFLFPHVPNEIRLLQPKLYYARYLAHGCSNLCAEMSNDVEENNEWLETLLSEASA